MCAQEMDEVAVKDGRLTLGLWSISEGEDAKAFIHSLENVLTKVESVGDITLCKGSAGLDEVVANCDILIVNLTKALETDEYVADFLELVVKQNDLPSILFMAPEQWDGIPDPLEFNGFKPFRWLVLLLRFINYEYVALPADLNQITEKIKDLLKFGKKRNLSRDFWKTELKNLTCNVRGNVERVATALMDSFSEDQIEEIVEKQVEGILKRVLRISAVEAAESATRFYLNINDYISDSEQARRDIFHGIPYEANPCLGQAYKEFVNISDLCLALADHSREDIYRVLIIDNHITKANGNEPFVERLRKDIERILRYFKEMDFYLIEESFEEFKRKLDDGSSEIDGVWLKHLDKETMEWKEWAAGSDIHNFMLILQDLDLGIPNLTGEDFLLLFPERCPETPVFICSGSEDYDTVRRTLKSGADHFVNKRDILSLPLKIQDYERDLGKLLKFIKDRDLRKIAVGNTRRWRIDKNILWHGDKCSHMVDHGYEHTNNVWNLSNDLLCPILNPILEKNSGLFSDEDIFCLSMAIWLHDIGHRGNSKYGVTSKIRANHGVIASELILAHPELYGLDNSILHCCSGRCQCVECIQNAGNEMCLLKKIALICRYHQSNTPMDDEGYKKLIDRKKLIPDECYEGYERLESNRLTLQQYDSNGDNICKLASVLRLVDGIDTTKNRVGDQISRKTREQTVTDEIEFYKMQLGKFVESKIGESREVKFPKKEMNELFKNFLSKEIGVVVNGNLEDVKSKQFEYLTHGMLDLREYYTNLDHISALAGQKEHYDLHSSVNKIEVVYDRNNHRRLNLRYICNKGDLIAGKVEKKSIPEQICGDVRKEWSDCKEYLGDTRLLKPGRIIFCERNGKEIEYGCLGLAEDLTWIDENSRE